MKKLILTAIVALVLAFSLVSCKSPMEKMLEQRKINYEKLKSDVEKEIKRDLLDPTSYKFISLDTNFTLNYSVIERVNNFNDSLMKLIVKDISYKDLKVILDAKTLDVVRFTTTDSSSKTALLKFRAQSRGGNSVYSEYIVIYNDYLCSVINKEEIDEWWDMVKYTKNGKDWVLNDYEK